MPAAATGDSSEGELRVKAGEGSLDAREHRRAGEGGDHPPERMRKTMLSSRFSSRGQGDAFPSELDVNAPARFARRGGVRGRVRFGLSRRFHTIGPRVRFCERLKLFSYLGAFFCNGEKLLGPERGG